MIEVEHINGYELFALCKSQSSEGLAFNEYRADLGDGFRQQTLYGSTSGTRTWNFSFKTLAGGGYNPSIDLDGLAMSSATYLQDLFVRTKNSGKPFVVQSPVNDQYYLAEFADSSLSLDRALVKLFSSGINLRQVRIPNVTVFDKKVSSPFAWLRSSDFDADYDDGEAIASEGWTDETGNNHHFGITTGATMKKNQARGRSLIRLNGTSGYFKYEFPVTIYQALMVIRIYESTFSNQSGILTALTNGAPDNDALLIGANGTNRFFNTGLGNYYEKNGIHYPESNQRAPMNELAIIYLESPIGGVFDGIQIGKDRNIGGFAKIDLGEILLWDERVPRSVIWECTEALANEWL